MIVPFDTMTINDVLKWQDDYVANGSASSAAGRYQVVRKTLRRAVKEMGLTGDELYDPAMQDQIALHLLKADAGLDKFEAGIMDPKEFQDNIAKVWAGIPNRSGKSHYDGDGLNAATVSVEDVQSALGEFVQGGADWSSLGYENIPKAERLAFRVWNDNPVANSERNLGSVHPQLQDVIRRAQEISPVKFVVASGLRTPEDQRKAIQLGWSDTEDSEHLGGLASDLWVLDDKGQVTFDEKAYRQLSIAMKQAAKSLGYKLKWGGEWKTPDIPHFEITPKEVETASN
jgi:hypothetical protein